VGHDLGMVLNRFSRQRTRSGGLFVRRNTSEGSKGHELLTIGPSSCAVNP
jgi:hypothetical protein